MMTTRELKHSPQILPLYLRAAATLVPGAGRLPGLPGGGGEIPDLELLLRDAALELDPPCEVDEGMWNWFDEKAS